MKYIFVSGGVISGLGKGVTTSSISCLLSSYGFIVSPVKIDMYLNIDAGTIRPQEHGEVFVTEDGTETDQDLGHYERFLDANLSSQNYITTGQVYLEVLKKERSFYYKGEDVEAIPHVTDEIISRIKQAGRAKKADIVIAELGGTAGEYQNSLFFEASRILKLKQPKDVIHVHVAYLPIPKSLGEMKSKPVQQSVKVLNSMGIQPDFIVGRAEQEIDKKRKERIALFCNVKEEDVISNPDISPVYALPLYFERQNFSKLILKKLGLSAKQNDLKNWKKLINNIQNIKEKEEVEIAIVGKYAKVGDFNLGDTYISIIESLKHAFWSCSKNLKIRWINAEEIEQEGVKALSKIKGLIIPGGFGTRGTEGKIKAIEYARKNKIPFLGLCFGLQMAVVEFSRNVCGLQNANSTEINKNTEYPVIDILPEQKKKMAEKDYGGSMRLGAYPCLLKNGSLTKKLYKEDKISERHRHRFEVNPKYHAVLEKNGLVLSGLSPNKRLVEIIELPAQGKQGHPFFLATQFHPEFKSRPGKPHPLFLGFARVIITQQDKN